MFYKQSALAMAHLAEKIQRLQKELRATDDMKKQKEITGDIELNSFLLQVLARQISGRLGSFPEDAMFDNCERR